MVNEDIKQKTAAAVARVIQRIRDDPQFKDWIFGAPMLPTLISGSCTIREMEHALRACGLSRTQAKRVAAHGFKGLTMVEEPEGTLSVEDLEEWLQEQKAVLR